MTVVVEKHYLDLTEKLVPAVRRIAEASWRNTYDGIFDKEYIDKFLAMAYSEKSIASLVPELAAGKVFFKVALLDGKPVGFCNISKTKEAYELTRIYLLPKALGQGIGKELLALGEAFLSAINADFYCCFVHKQNAQAIRFYKKNGFVHNPEYDLADDYYLVKHLPG